jgi:hypothetical protein
MSRPLRGERYLAKGARPEIVRYITNLIWFSFERAQHFYREVVPAMNGAEMALLGCNDRFFLLTGLCNRRDMIHPWLYERCREVELNPDGHLDLWARAHGKSSIITFAGVIQEILCDPEVRICIFSNTKDMAQPFVSQVKEELEGNDLLIGLYPDVLWKDGKERKQARSWAVGEGITVKRQGNPREATLEGHGLIEALPTGKHFNLLVYDDVINERTVTNPEQVKKAIERTQLSFNLGVGDGTRKWFIGTRYHYGDPYAYLLDPARAIVIPRVYTATDDDTLNGNPVFVSPETWAQVKREQRATVSAQYMQNPMAGEENTFLPKWLRSYYVRPSMMNVYIMGDPSHGHNKTSDRTAIAVIGIDTLGNKYLLDGFCHRMALSERWERLRDLYKRWSNMIGVQMVKVAWERYGMQSDLDYFTERQRVEKVYFGIEEVNWTGERGGESKKKRVGRLEPDFRGESFFVPWKVSHPALGVARWQIKEGSDEIAYEAVRGPHAEERRCKANSEHYRIMDPIRRVDEDGNIYDLTRVFFEEFCLFPFAPHDDLIDAVSRIYDMDPQPPMSFEAPPVPDYPDS